MVVKVLKGGLMLLSNFKIKCMFTLDVCVCVCINVNVLFNVASMETQTQMHKMGLNPFCASDGDVDANASAKC